MNSVTTSTTTTIGSEIILRESSEDDTTHMVVDQGKFEDLRKVVLDLSRASETVISQNAFLIQRLNELENNEYSKVQTELENKTAQLKQAYMTIADMKRRETESRSSNLTCIRCENGERQVVTLPCAHVCVCKVCAKFTNNCFLCGRRQESTLEVSFRL